MYQFNDDRPRGAPLPTMYDLPSEDPEEQGLPDEFHDFQPQLLRETFQPPNFPSERIFIGTDLNLYYDSRHPRWHKRPDWFVVLGVPRSTQQQDLRWSYVVWDEGRAPFLVVELLSLGTEAEDLGRTLREVQQPPTKWEVYEQILRIPYYVVFDRYTNDFRAFRLVATRYEELELAPQKLGVTEMQDESKRNFKYPASFSSLDSAMPKLWLNEVELGLGIWRGVYQGTEGLWLRWYDGAGRWLPTLAEQAEEERQRAEEERQRADLLAAKLRELEIDLEEME